MPKAAYLSPAWSGSTTLNDVWTWVLLDLLAQVKLLTLFALLFGAGLQLLFPRGRRWVQSRLALLALLGFIHGLFFWDGGILLAYALVGLVSWRMVRKAHHVESLFSTGVVLYLIDTAVLILLGVISGTAANRSWMPDATNLQYEQYWKLHGGMEAASNRADMLSGNLLALGTQYDWQPAGAMLMGAVLMRSGWLKRQFSLRHYRRTGALLVAAGMAVDLPAIFAQWYLAWDYRWCAFLLQAPRELGAPLQVIDCTSPAWGYQSQLCRFRLVGAIACVGRMVPTSYLLQTLTCTTLLYHLGLFIRFDHLQLLIFVPPIWAVNLLVSSLRPRRFRRGSAERLWRQLTLRAPDILLKDTSR